VRSDLDRAVVLRLPSRESGKAVVLILVSYFGCQTAKTCITFSSLVPAMQARSVLRKESQWE
jgi:hypothetical protein